MTGTVDTIILDPPPTDEGNSPEAQELARSLMDGFHEQRMPSSLMAGRIVGIGLGQGALRLLHRTATTTSDDRERARCYLVAGAIREQMGQFEAASRCYGAATPDLLGEADRYFAQNNLAYCLNRLGRHTEAEQTCLRAIAIDAKQFNAHKNLGIALERP